MLVLKNHAQFEYLLSDVMWASAPSLHMVFTDAAMTMIWPYR